MNNHGNLFGSRLTYFSFILALFKLCREYLIEGLGHKFDS